MSYRKVWESVYGSIPPGYEIHHIDGNRKNNHISNLKCVTTEEHYAIHYSQGDYLACAIMSGRIGLTPEQKKKIHKKAMAKRDQTGEKNPMYGKKHSEETKRKIGSKSKDRNWWRPDYYDGANNPRARKVKINDTIYECIKDASEDLGINYNSLKGAAVRGHSKKYNIKVEYLDA